MKFESSSEDNTKTIARDFSKKLQIGDIILLHGNLGAGKSVFAREVIRSLMYTPNLEVPSPTFTLVQNYEGPESCINHYDLYRLENPEEVYELGWEDALGNSIMLIEWPERLGPLKPKKATEVSIKQNTQDKNTRNIEIKGPKNE